MMHDQRGQAVAELAMVMPLLLLLVMGSLYLGLYVLRHMQVHSAAVQAARVGLEKCPGGEAEIKAAAGALAPDSTVDVVCDTAFVRVSIEQTIPLHMPGMFQVRPIRHQVLFPLIPTEDDEP